MRSSLRAEIFDLPRALRQTLEKGKRSYDELIRRVPWGVGPKAFVAAPGSMPLAEFMSAAFADLLGWPCSAQQASEAAPRIIPGGVCFLISEGDDATALSKWAMAARSENCHTLALVSEKDDLLVRVADGAFVVRQNEELGGIRLDVCRHAVSGFLAMLAARALKKPVPRFERLEREFHELPALLEKTFAQQGSGVRSLAEELAGARQLMIAAGGAYACPAAFAAGALGRLAGITATVQLLGEQTSIPELGRGAVVLVPSGARGRTRKLNLEAAKLAQRGGAKVLALTDGNDAELVRQATMTLLVPPLDDITGSVLIHALMGWTAYEASRLNLMGRARPKS